MYSIVIQYYYMLYSIQNYCKRVAVFPCDVLYALVAYLFYTQ